MLMSKSLCQSYKIEDILLRLNKLIGLNINAFNVQLTHDRILQIQIFRKVQVL